MFSHLAEETSRLAHGFLGALFSIIVVYSHENFGGVLFLCVALYIIFFFNSLSLYFLFGVVIDKKKRFIKWLAFFSFSGFFLWATIVAGFFTNQVFEFDGDTHRVICLGISVFTLFLGMVDISHCSVLIERVGFADQEEDQ